MKSSPKDLLGSASIVVLSAAAILASSAARPAAAQAITNGIYVGGSTLASEAFRQIFDCYAGTTVGNDGFTFSSSFHSVPPTPGLLPTTCTSHAVAVQGMYAGVGSGNGIRGYVSNNPSEWYGGSLTPNSTTNVAIATPFPAVQPPYVDSANTVNFGSYPYPRIDIALSDSPLADVGTTASFTTVALSFTPTNNWATAGISITSITLNSSTQVATFATTKFGKTPIQIPAFEVNVAVPVNVHSTNFQINSQITSNGSIVAGGAIQLTEGQLCAIFSGLVTNWNDAGTTIPYLDSTGTQQTANFDYANVGNGVSTPQPYASASLPITVVYRSDGSGTSFITTNYLHNVCPLLDPNDTYKYKSIFASGPKTLPSTSFADLVTNIVAARGNGPWNATSGAHWLGESGSGGVAATISNKVANAGYIGYVSADYTMPYAKTVSGAGLTNVAAPQAASLQDEAQRISGVNVPNTTATTVPTFIKPTPTSANLAWSDTRLQAPAGTWTYANYNIYNHTFTTTVTQGGVSLFGQSVLPLTNVAGAYPLSGTTFLDLYSCYNVQADSARVTNLVNFLSWYANGSITTSGTYDPDVGAVVQNAGFHLVPSRWAQNYINRFLTPSTTTAITAAAAINSHGCTGVAGGASGGAM